MSIEAAKKPLRNLTYRVLIKDSFESSDCIALNLLIISAQIWWLQGIGGAWRLLQMLSQRLRHGQ